MAFIRVVIVLLYCRSGMKKKKKYGRKVCWWVFVSVAIQVFNYYYHEGSNPRQRESGANKLIVYFGAEYVWHDGQCEWAFWLFVVAVTNQRTHTRTHRTRKCPHKERRLEWEWVNEIEDASPHKNTIDLCILAWHDDTVECHWLKLQFIQSGVCEYDDDDDDADCNTILCIVNSYPSHSAQYILSDNVQMVVDSDGYYNNTMWMGRFGG